ncbi:MAG: hypothetical protein ACREDO_00220 [Methyloceanibacter sp.]
MKRYAGDLAAIEGFLESATAHFRAIKLAVESGDETPVWAHLKALTEQLDFAHSRSSIVFRLRFPDNDDSQPPDYRVH